MSTMEHFPKYSVVYGGFVAVKLDLSWMNKNVPDAQAWLGEQVLASSKRYMPFREGFLQDESHTEDGGKKVVFPGPYGRFQYMGVVMVDSVTGKGPRKIPTGPGGEFVFRFKEGAKLKPTDRKLNYSRAEARDHWFEEAKVADKDAWIRGTREELVKR